MDLKDRIDLESIIFEKETTTVDELNQKFKEKLGVTDFDLECELVDGK